MTERYLNASTYLDLPPPIACCHLIIHPILQLLVLIVFLGSISHPILKCRVPNQLSHTLDWIPPPELNLFNDSVAILVLAIAGDLEDFTSPLWTLREAVDFLEECMFVVCGWASTGLNLGGDSASKIITMGSCTYCLQF